MVVIVIEKARWFTRLAMQVKNKEWPLIDIGITATHFCLRATELGLGTCMIGWFDENKMKQLLGIPNDKTIGLEISVGYPVPDYKQRTKIRKSMDEISCRGQYSG